MQDCLPAGPAGFPDAAGPAGSSAPTGPAGPPDSAGLAGPDRPALTALGWGPPFDTAFEDRRDEDAVPGRVARVDRAMLTVLTEAGEVRAPLAQRRLPEPDPSKAPTVGDWVVLQDRCVVAILPRRTEIVRGASGTDDIPQVLAANVDKVFVLCSLEGRFRARRLERLLVLAWQTGAAPVAILTKSDIADDVDGAVDAARRLTGGGEVLAVSSLTGEGMEAVAELLEAGVTVALFGPSGAGKSTLANWLGRGEVDLATGEIRDDGKGRHTTTARELVMLPGGALMIDTPGLRALALWHADEAIGDAFGEIEELAERCRFSDCGHRSEPGCAILEAIAAGRLEAERYNSFDKLRREQRRIESRVDPRVRAEERKRQKALGKLSRRPYPPGPR